MGSCVFAGRTARALLIPSWVGYLALEERRAPRGFAVAADDFYGAFRFATGDVRLAVPVLLTAPEQLELLYFFDTLDRVTGGFPHSSAYRFSAVLPAAADVLLRSRVDGEAHRPQRWSLEVEMSYRDARATTTLDFDSYVVGRVAWDLADFLPGVSDADMDWPDLDGDVLIPLQELMADWEPEKRLLRLAEDQGGDGPLFPLQALAGHLERGDTAKQLLAFVDEELRRLGIEPVPERERDFVTRLVGWREQWERESAERAFAARVRRSNPLPGQERRLRSLVESS
jgi:hypothetical protein